MRTTTRILSDIFSLLGERLSGFGETPESVVVIEKACEKNPWFTTGDITEAVHAIRDEMLRAELIEPWLNKYKPDAAAKKVGVIMAGNIPLVGFFDMMCVLASGHACYVKPSSKDTALMVYVISLLKEIWSDIETNVPLYYYNDQPIDAVIATGSDNSNRYFKSMFGDIPSVLRGSRYSAAILTGNETKAQLDGLAKDIFMYSGLGCRNVCKLFVPLGYDLSKLVDQLSDYKNINPKYLNNLKQRIAVLAMNDENIYRGGHFILREDDGFPVAISEITYARYASIHSAIKWLKSNDSKIQCVVCDTENIEELPPRAISFGRSQYPGLSDYPDDIDIMDFLSSL